MTKDKNLIKFNPQHSFVFIIFTSILSSTALVSSFGPNGSIYSILPYEDSYWYNYGYSTLVTSLSFIICLFGAKSFGRTTVIVFLLVAISTLLMFASFFPAKIIVATFTYLDYEDDYCIESDDDTDSRYFLILSYTVLYSLCLFCVHPWF